MKSSVIKKFKIWLILAIMILVAGTVMLSVLGFNDTLDTGSSYEITVDCEENILNSESISETAANKYFAQKGINPVNYATARTGEGKIIYRFKTNPNVNKEELKTAVQSELTANGIALEVTVKGYSANTYADSQVMWTLIGGAVALVVAFIYLLLTEKADGAITVVSVGALSALLFVDMLGITRLPLRPFGGAVAAGVTVLASVISVVMVNRFNQSKKTDSGSKLPNADIADDGALKSVLRLCFIFGALLVGAIVLVAIGTPYLRLLGLELIVADVIACGTSFAFTPMLWSKLKKEKKKPAAVADVTGEAEE